MCHPGSALLHPPENVRVDHQIAACTQEMGPFCAAVAFQDMLGTSSNVLATRASEVASPGRAGHGAEAATAQNEASPLENVNAAEVQEQLAVPDR